MATARAATARPATGPAGFTTALLYTRVSGAEQAAEGLSLPAQLAACRRYAADQGWAIGTEYQDILSGKRDDRPAYQRLLADARRLRGDGQRVVVTVAWLHRFGRRVLERVRSREELKALGVATHSAKEGGEVSDLVSNIFASVAEEEVRQLGERVTEINDHTRRAGWRVVGRVGWGYRWREATAAERAAGSPRSVLDVEEAEAPYVVEAFRMLAAGASLRQTAAWAAGLPAAARGGRVMAPASMGATLRAPVYCGRTEGDDVARPGPVGHWPALVDAATWLAVQARIAGHRKMPRQASGKYLLTGLLRCATCGARMAGNRSAPGSPRAARYLCIRDMLGAQADADPDRQHCHATALLEPVDAAVRVQVQAVVEAVAGTDPDVRAAARRRWRALTTPEGSAAVAAAVTRLERARATAKTRLADAAILLIDGTLTKDGYDAATARINDDLAAADAALERLRAEGPGGRLGAVEATTLPATFDAALAGIEGWTVALADGDVGAQRRVLAELVARVTPVRAGRGRYTAQIEWTPWGKALAAAGPAPPTPPRGGRSTRPSRTPADAGRPASASS